MNDRWRRVGLTIALVCAPALLAGKEDPWLKLQTPEFTVITSLKQKEAVAWSGEFTQFIAALQGFFSQGKQPLAPLTIVLFARDRDFLAYRPLGTDGKPQDVAGFFSRQAGSAVAALGSPNESEELRRTIFHEGTHWFMSSFGQTQPVWLEEGLAEVFSTFEVEKGKAKWGSPIGEHVMALHEWSRLPVARLLAVGQGELFHGNSIQTGIVYAESWAFVHYLIFGQHKIPRNALSEYVELSRSALSREDAFKRAFGRTIPEMDREFQQYLEGGAYYVSRQPLAAIVPPQVVPASAADVANALGRLALASGRGELAEKHARTVIAAAPEKPEGYDLLGLTLKLKNDLPGARAAFQQSVARNSREFEGYFELALAEQDPASDDGKSLDSISADTARRIANRYEQAINLEPRFLGSFQNLAGIIGLVEPVTDADRRFLELGRKLYPDDRMITVGLAVLAKRAGDDVKARTLLNEVLDATAQPPDVRRFAGRLDAAWEQQEIVERTNALAREGKFQEGADYVSQRLERGVQQSIRAQCLDIRRQLTAHAQVQEAQKALDEKRWVDARQLITAILASDASPFLKKQVQLSLDQLNQRRLGLAPATTP